MKKMALALGVTMGVAGAFGLVQLVACSSDTQDTDGGPGKDGGKLDTGAADSGNPTDSGNPADSGCATITLHPNPDAGAYCPFQAGDGGNNKFDNCAGGQHCCEYAVSANLPSTCNAGNSPCTVPPDAGPNYDWKCNEKDDCTGNDICCLVGNVITPDKYCVGQAFTTGVTGSICKASCTTLPDAGAGNEVQLCASQSECTGGKTCMPFKKVGGQYGVCL